MPQTGSLWIISGEVDAHPTGSTFSMGSKNSLDEIQVVKADFGRGKQRKVGILTSPPPNFIPNPSQFVYPEEKHGHCVTLPYYITNHLFYEYPVKDYFRFEDIKFKIDM